MSKTFEALLQAQSDAIGEAVATTNGDRAFRESLLTLAGVAEFMDAAKWKTFIKLVPALAQAHLVREQLR